MIETVKFSFLVFVIDIFDEILTSDFETD